jgi:hypothetical protein
MSHWSMVPLVPHESLFALMVHDLLFALMAHAPSSRPFRCSYVKGIRAPVSASLLCPIERNCTHDDECHRRAFDVRDVRIYLPGNTHRLVARMKFS